MLQIALTYGEETHHELEALGFKLWMVYAKQGERLATPEATMEAGDSAVYLASRKLRPNMFLTTPTGLQIILAWVDGAESAIQFTGFVPRQVYVKYFYYNGDSQEQRAAGDAEFRAMQNPPEEFITASYWGAGPD